MIHRDCAKHLKEILQERPSITLTGPRQSGKTTLCRKIFSDYPYVSLEYGEHREYAQKDPQGFLAQYSKGAILDEIQRVPELLSELMGLIDENRRTRRWILSGSQNLSMLEAVKQTLVGRTSIAHLLPLSHGEVLRFPNHPTSLEDILFRGSYPEIYNTPVTNVSLWYQDYMSTYVSKDIEGLRDVTHHSEFIRFMCSCALHSAKLLNLSSIASDCEISLSTARAWLNMLEASFIVFRLPVFSAKMSSQIKKMPKLHFYDTGLLCWLLKIYSPSELKNSRHRGCIFESWVVSEVHKMRTHRGRGLGLSFYRDKERREVDLLLEGVLEGENKQKDLILLEAKYSSNARHYDPKGALEKFHKQMFTVYGGEASENRGRNRLLSWKHLKDLDWNRLEGR